MTFKTQQQIHDESHKGIFEDCDDPKCKSLNERSEEIKSANLKVYEAANNLMNQIKETLANYGTFNQLNGTIPQFSELKSAVEKYDEALKNLSDVHLGPYGRAVFGRRKRRS